MTQKTIWSTLVIPATAVGLFAQNNVAVTRSLKTADEGVMLAQGAVGVIGLSSEPGNVRFMTQQDFVFNGSTVTNAPYSADEKTESVQTLADGTKITNVTTARIYRDSQGRTRREMTLPGPGDEKHTMITISDPVAGASFTLDPQMKIAHQMPAMGPDGRMKDLAAKVQAESEAKSTATFIRRTLAPTGKHEDLGADVIEGVSATGTRDTNVIEAGAMGNDRPITITSERWMSPDLGVELKSVRNDPRFGQTTHSLTNISRTEPDASLFQVPRDYSLDEGKTMRFEYHSVK